MSGSAGSAVNNDFFTSERCACESFESPKYPPSKEMDVKMRDEVARRQKGLTGKSHAVDGNKRARAPDLVGRAVPAPEANTEIQSNLDALDIFRKSLHPEMTMSLIKDFWQA